MTDTEGLPDLPDSLRSPAQVAIVRSLDPVMQEFAVEHYRALEAQGIVLQFNSGRRDPAAQAALYEQRADLSVPVARPGTSHHEVGLAYDGEPRPKNDATWAAYGAAAEALGLSWGGRFRKPDPPHVELPGKRELIMQLGAGGLLAAIAWAIVRRARRAGR